MLHQIIREAATREKKVVFAWLDLTNAYSSAPSEAIHEAWSLHQVLITK